MVARFALKGELQRVRLQDVPIGVRKDAAEKAARKWGLTGLPLLELMIAAHDPGDHRPLLVDIAKIEQVMAGKTVPGDMPDLPPDDPWRKR